MSFRDEIFDMLDVDDNGKVNLDDAVKAAENHYGTDRARGFAIGFSVGVAVVLGLFLAYRFL